MFEPENRYERLIFWIAKHVQPRSVAIIAFLSYAGFGLALPLLLGWSMTWLVLANFVGTTFAGSLLITWLVLQLQARDRRHLLEWTSDLRLLDGQEFEWFVGELFRREGWAVLERGRQDAADGNVDLVLTRGSTKRLVQCKRWESRWVGVDQIRMFVGTLAREKLQPSAGVFVTLSSFNLHAVAEAEAAGLELVDNAELLRRVENVRKAEPCPVCSQSMVLDRSLHGWWLRCQAPGCTGKRHLDRDPGRAVALLIDDA